MYGSKYARLCPLKQQWYNLFLVEWSLSTPQNYTTTIIFEKP